jgi:aldehyde:ferredoxin oxidoreductase
MFVCQGPLQTTLDTLNAISGLGFDKEAALKVGERVINLLRLFNIRQGLTPDHDSISLRLSEAPKEGVAQGKTIGPYLDEMRQNYYKLMGWDEQTGRPLPETLKRLGLET